MRKYYSGEILLRGVLRRYVSQNIVAITGNLRLNKVQPAQSLATKVLISRSLTRQEKEKAVDKGTKARVYRSLPPEKNKNKAKAAKKLAISSKWKLAHIIHGSTKNINLEIQSTNRKRQELVGMQLFGCGEEIIWGIPGTTWERCQG